MLTASTLLPQIHSGLGFQSLQHNHLLNDQHLKPSSGPSFVVATPHSHYTSEELMGDASLSSSDRRRKGRDGRQEPGVNPLIFTFPPQSHPEELVFYTNTLPPPGIPPPSTQQQQQQQKQQEQHQQQQQRSSQSKEETKKRRREKENDEDEYLPPTTKRSGRNLSHRSKSLPSSTSPESTSFPSHSKKSSNLSRSSPASSPAKSSSSSSPRQVCAIADCTLTSRKGRKLCHKHQKLRERGVELPALREGVSLGRSKKPYDCLGKTQKYERQLQAKEVLSKMLADPVAEQQVLMELWPNQTIDSIIARNARSFFHSLPSNSPFRLQYLAALSEGLSDRVMATEFNVPHNALVRAKQQHPSSLSSISPSISPSSSTTTPTCSPTRSPPITSIRIKRTSTASDSTLPEKPVSKAVSPLEVQQPVVQSSESINNLLGLEPMINGLDGGVPERSGSGGSFSMFPSFMVSSLAPINFHLRDAPSSSTTTDEDTANSQQGTTTGDTSSSASSSNSSSETASAPEAVPASSDILSVDYHFPPSSSTSDSGRRSSITSLLLSTSFNPEEPESTPCNPADSSSSSSSSSRPANDSNAPEGTTPSGPPPDSGMEIEWFESSDLAQLSQDLSGAGAEPEEGGTADGSTEAEECFIVNRRSR